MTWSFGLSLPSRLKVPCWVEHGGLGRGHEVMRTKRELPYASMLCNDLWLQAGATEFAFPLEVILGGIHRLPTADELDDIWTPVYASAHDTAGD